jgi:NAD(P)H-nitrite reductase large subunit
VPAEEVASLEKTAYSLKIMTRSGHEFHIDGIVAGLGIRPNVKLAKSAGLKVKNGIVVNDRQRTSAPDVFAVGDVTS